jgi:AcrR family transcriptional regulator
MISSEEGQEGMAVQHRAEETRERILLAAHAVFAGQGYDAASVADICERAGVSKGALYHHFPTKQAVFLALLEEWLAGVDFQLESYRQGVGVPAAFERMAEMIGSVFQDGAGQLPLFLSFWAEASHDPVVWKTTVAYYRRYTDFFTTMIEAGIAEGSLRPCPAADAARSLVSFAVGLILQGLLDPQGADWGQTARAGIKLWLCALENDHQESKEVTTA